MTNTEGSEILTRDEIVAAVTATTHEVFSTMLRLEISPGVALPDGTSSTAGASGVVALVGLAGSWSGTGSLACTGEFACSLASRLLDSHFDSVNEEVLDVVGEIANMILGNVKTILEMRLGPMGLSTPTVIFGRNFQTRTARAREWTVVAFDAGEERMLVQLSLAPNQDVARPLPRGGFVMPHVMTL